MRVNHFNSYDHGGAALAALRIHRGLNDLDEANLTSHFFYRFAQKDQPDRNTRFPTDRSQIKFKSPPSHWPPSIQRFIDRRRQKKIYRLFDRHLAPRDVHRETFAMADLPQSTWLDWTTQAADVVHLHWLSFLADFPSFFRSIPVHVPLVWTLHDLNPFTGGCHYSNGCQKFRRGCGNCPQVANPTRHDVSWHSFRSKQRHLRRRNITVVSPCKWLTELARSSPLWPTDTKFETIHYGLDLDRFSPVEKNVARHELGIAMDANSTLIAFGADNLNNPRKGSGLLLAALQQVAAHLSEKNQPSASVAAIVFGNGQIESLPGVTLYQMGFVDSPARQRTIYSAADLVVVPSLEDNQPQVGLEAMACERPVVGFDSGGISQYVRHEQTGLLAKAESTQDLALKLIRLIGQPDYCKVLGGQARELVQQEFEIGQQSRRYYELYQRLLQRPQD